MNFERKGYKIFRRTAGPVRHLQILIISLAVSLVVQLIRLLFGRSMHSPLQDILTLTLIIFLIGELILRLVDPKFRRRLLLSVLRLYKREPLTPQVITRKALLGLLAMCGITLFCVHTTYRFDRTTERLSAQKEVALLSSELLQQEIIGFEKEPLAAINVRFGANAQIPGQTNDGNVHISLYKDDDKIQSWDLPFAMFTTESYQKLELNSLLKMQSDSHYYLRIREKYGEEYEEEKKKNAEGDTEVSVSENTGDSDGTESGDIYTTENAEGMESSSIQETALEPTPISVYVYAEGGEGYERDGEPHTCCLCYTLTYRNLELKNIYTLGGVLLGILVALIILLDIEETAVMTVVLAILMLVFMQICPPFMAPDEENHFKRAFEVAEIGYVSRHMGETGVGGNIMPAAIDDYVWLYLDKPEEELLAEAAAAEASEKETEAADAAPVFISPASFLPEGATYGPGIVKPMSSASDQDDSDGSESSEAGADSGDADFYEGGADSHENEESADETSYDEESYDGENTDGENTDNDGTDGENGDSRSSDGEDLNGDGQPDSEDGTAGTGANPAMTEMETGSKEKPVILLDWNQTKEMEFGNTALYSPVSYLPLSAGIRVANVFSDQVATLFYGGRWGNVIANFLLCIFALRLAPFGKRILFLIMTFPMTLQEMVSLTPDGFTISICLFFLAYILRLSYGTSGDPENPRIRKVTPLDMAALAVSSVVLSQIKIVYVILLLLLFMIPGSRFRTKRTALIFKGVTAIFALALNLLWLSTSSGFLVEFQPGVDTPAQIDYVLSHIPVFYEVCARTLINSFASWTSTMTGSTLGTLNISVTPIVWLTATILFVAEITTCRENRQDVHRWDMLLLILTFLGGCALIMASLYAQWTPYRSPVIRGIQGRYFTPLLPLLAYFVVFTLQSRRKHGGIDPAADALPQRGTFCYLLVLFYNGIAVLDIAAHFIADLW